MPRLELQTRVVWLGKEMGLNVNNETKFLGCANKTP